MGLAILVIDMPKDCWDCHLVDEWGNCEAIKITSNKYGMSVKQNDKERASWCPLKPLPEYEKPQDPDETWEEMHVIMGYNKCLEDITNEP